MKFEIDSSKKEEYNIILSKLSSQKKNNYDSTSIQGIPLKDSTADGDLYNVNKLFIIHSPDQIASYASLSNQFSNSLIDDAFNHVASLNSDLVEKLLSEEIIYGTISAQVKLYKSNSLDVYNPFDVLSNDGFLSEIPVKTMTDDSFSEIDFKLYSSKGSIDNIIRVSDIVEDLRFSPDKLIFSSDIDAIRQDYNELHTVFGNLKNINLTFSQDINSIRLNSIIPKYMFKAVSGYFMINPNDLHTGQGFFSSSSRLHLLRYLETTLETLKEHGYLKYDSSHVEKVISLHENKLVQNNIKYLKNEPIARKIVANEPVSFVERLKFIQDTPIINKDFTWKKLQGINDFGDISRLNILRKKIDLVKNTNKSPLVNNLLSDIKKTFDIHPKKGGN